MGLHFQCNQEVPAELRFRSAGPFCGYYDSTLYGCVCEAADQNLP